MSTVRRLRARELGQTRYKGAPCYKGHNGDRLTFDNACVECRRETQRKYQAKMRQENRKKYNAKHRKINAEFRENNREYYNAYHREYRRKNPEKIEAILRRHYKKTEATHAHV